MGPKSRVMRPVRSLSRATLDPGFCQFLRPIRGLSRQYPYAQSSLQSCIEWSLSPAMTEFRLPLRFLGLAIGLVVGVAAGNAILVLGESHDTRAGLISFCIAIGGIGYLVGPHLSQAVFRNIRRSVSEASTLDIVAIGVGLGFGAIVSAALTLPLSFLPDPLGTFLPVIAAILACTFSIAVVLLRKRDLIAPWLRSRSVKPSAPSATVTSTPRPTSPPPEGFIIDTNVLIDGRITDVLATGFLAGSLLVPRFVLDELQHIADSDDQGRRIRGRRGLDMLSTLRSERPDQLVVLDELVPEEHEVDAKLVRLAKSRGVRILTNDYNLNRVAQVQDVQVLNLNELTNALRPLVRPGEEISLNVVQEGREAGQGVGFLDDGTMVVVDGGRSLIGQQVAVTVTRLLQTAAGRMVFATAKQPARV